MMCLYIGLIDVLREQSVWFMFISGVGWRVDVAHLWL